MELIVYKKGVAHSVFYDESDHDLISSYKWYVHVQGYAVGRLKNGPSRNMFMMHKIIMTGPETKYYVDHINHNKLDNRRANLRICLFSENMFNRPKVKGKSPYLGVVLCSSYGRYIAQCSAFKKNHRIGKFDTQEEAAIERDIKALELHGEFCVFNFPEFKDQYQKISESNKEDATEIKRSLVSEKTTSARTEDQKAFDIRVRKVEWFKSKLKTLLDKSGFGISESDQYDGEENYCGSIRYFVIDGEPLYVSSIDEILKEVGLI
jgi:hypothetical protein